MTANVDDLSLIARQIRGHVLQMSHRGDTASRFIALVRRDGRRGLLGRTSPRSMRRQ